MISSLQYRQETTGPGTSMKFGTHNKMVNIKLDSQNGVQQFYKVYKGDAADGKVNLSL